MKTRARGGLRWDARARLKARAAAQPGVAVPGTGRKRWRSVRRPTPYKRTVAGGGRKHPREKRDKWW